MPRLKPRYQRSTVRKLVGALSPLTRHARKKIAAADLVAAEAEAVASVAVATAVAEEATAAAVDAVVTEAVAVEAAEADVAAVAEDATNIADYLLPRRWL